MFIVSTDHTGVLQGLKFRALIVYLPTCSSITGKHFLLLLFASQNSHFPPLGRVILPRPSMCHTSSLQTPSDKEQALQVSVSQKYFTFSLPLSLLVDLRLCSCRCHIVSPILKELPLVWLLSAFSCRSRTCCRWLVPCSKPGPTLW